MHFHQQMGHVDWPSERGKNLKKISTIIYFFIRINNLDIYILYKNKIFHYNQRSFIHSNVNKVCLTEYCLTSVEKST